MARRYAKFSTAWGISVDRLPAVIRSAYPAAPAPGSVYAAELVFDDDKWEPGQVFDGKQHILVYCLCVRRAETWRYNARHGGWHRPGYAGLPEALRG